MAKTVAICVAILACMVMLPWRSIARAVITVTSAIVLLIALITWTDKKRNSPLVHSRRRAALQPLTFSTPSAWSAAATKRSWEEAPVAVLLHTDVAVNQRIDRVFELVKSTFILPWYIRISPSQALPLNVETMVRQILLEVSKRAEAVDWPNVTVSKVLPLITGHFQHYKIVEHLSTDEGIPLPLPQRSHPALESSAALESHLRSWVDRILAVSLKEKSAVSETLVREIALGAVVLPLFLMICEGDFWNKQIDERVGRYLYEQRQVNRFLSAISSIPPASPRIAPSISASSSTKQFEAFLRSIPKLRTLGEARRLKADIEREQRLAARMMQEAGDENHLRAARRYVKKLERAQLEVESRIGRLDRGKSEPPRAQMVNEDISLTLQNVMSDPSSLAYWLEFMERRGRAKMVQFWLTVEGLKDPLEEEALREGLKEDLASLWMMYLSDGAIEVDELALRRATKTDATPQDISNAHRAMLAGQKMAYENMETDDWPEFRRSELYRKAVMDLSRPALPRTSTTPQTQKMPPLVRTPSAPAPASTSLPVTPPGPSQLDFLTASADDDRGKLFEDEEDHEQIRRMEAIQAALNDAIAEDNNVKEDLGRSIDSLGNPSVPSTLTVTSSPGKSTFEDIDTPINQLEQQLHLLEDLIKQAEQKGDSQEMRILQKSLRAIRREQWSAAQGKLICGRVRISIPSSSIAEGQVVKYNIAVVQLDQSGSMNDQWTVARRYNEFWSLDKGLRGVLGHHVQLPPKRLVTNMSSSFVDARRVALERYLQNVVLSAEACESATLASFLSSTTTPDAHEERSGFTTPISDLFLEVLDLKENNWIRRQAIVVLQQVLGGAIERKYRDMFLLPPDLLERHLGTLQETLWPGGQRRAATAPRTEEEKWDTKRTAARKLGMVIPDVVANVIGRGNARRAARRVFGIVQDERLNQHLLLCILDEVFGAMFQQAKG